MLFRESCIQYSQQFTLSETVSNEASLLTFNRVVFARDEVALNSRFRDSNIVMFEADVIDGGLSDEHSFRI
jgi:hypothetical protein